MHAYEFKKQMALSINAQGEEMRQCQRQTQGVYNKIQKDRNPTLNRNFDVCKGTFSVAMRAT